MKDRLHSFYHPGFRFVSGLLLIPPWILQNSLTLKSLLFIPLLGLTYLSGKKLKWGYFFLLTLSISFFHLLTPTGQVLFYLGRFPITTGALYQGVYKGVSLIGLVFISLFSVTPGLQLPGSLGGLLGKMLLYYQEILSCKPNLRPGKIISHLDDVMIQLAIPESKGSNTIKTSFQGITFSVLEWILFYGCLFLPFDPIGALWL